MLIPEIGYYTCTKTLDFNGYDMEPGTLIYVYYVSNNVRFLWGESKFRSEFDEFDGHFAFSPDGEKLMQDEVLAAQNDLLSMSTEQIAFDKTALDFKPHIADGEFQTGSGLMASGNTPEGAKKAISLFRNDIEKFSIKIKEKKERLDQLIKRQSAIVESRIAEFTALMATKTKELTEFVKRANEAIKTINLYLGKDANIHQITAGEPAPKDTMISVRQMVLYMDEECAEDYVHGIDAKEIGCFDAWLKSDPKHLQQVFPEQKGMIALRPRRKHRDYGECMWTNAAMAAANKQTYFLIRNGENLYRFWLEFDIGTRMFPLDSDFSQLFVDRDGEPLLPGSEAYMKAMDESEEVSKHYYRVGLIIQGLLDRTDLLKPLPAPRINILDRKAFDQFITFIADDDKSKMFSDSLVPFKMWLKDINSRLCLGQRIMGHFYFSYGKDGYDRSGSTRDERVFPPNADLPKDDELYLLEKKGDKPCSFNFYYDRKETVRKPSSHRYYYAEAEVRARITIFQDDDFLLNFDDPGVTSETLNKYIKSRVNRHEYESMIPLLKRALIIKEQETKAEEPFILLLASQIAKAHHIEIAAAKEVVPELVQWWKFKNQTHRALDSDDKKAIKMIVDEYGIRRRRAAERSAISDDRLVQDLIAKITKEYPNVVLIAHKAKNEYTALIALNDDNVYVTEQLWKLNRSSSCPAGNRIRLADAKDWVSIDARADRWQALYTADRWNHWIRNATRSYYLTDRERQLAIEHVLENLPNGQLPLAMLRRMKDKEEISIYVIKSRYSIQNKFDFCEPTRTRHALEWTRIQGKISFSLICGHSTYSWNSDDPWTSTYEDQSPFVLMREWPENTLTFNDDDAVHTTQKKYIGRLENCKSDALESITEQIIVRERAREFAAYIKEHGDPELYKDDKHDNHYLDDDAIKRYSKLLRYAITEREIDCNGKTLQEVNDLMVGYTPIKRANDDKWWLHNTDDDDEDDEDEEDNDGNTKKKKKSRRLRAIDINPDDAHYLISHRPLDVNIKDEDDDED